MASPVPRPETLEKLVNAVYPSFAMLAGMQPDVFTPLHDGPRGDMRWRIVALLQEHPNGFSLAQTRQLLGSAKDLGSTMKAMVRDGLLQHVETGRYGVA
jgi:hypothetical protein